ncbi:cytochrome p450 [Trichoderma arundinaceum]|uniref:Cytochrome p450 n=1 Tax=Trichoderma arundinaceum TaxID=490622 RepID=A0A395N9Y6_TRIAR|nr:cytochrome p450 [Trichoderma arundinaceum]
MLSREALTELLPALTLSERVLCILAPFFTLFSCPRLAAATKWYEFYYDIVKSPGGQFAKKIERLHDEYGPIVRINPDEIHVRDPLWLDTLYAPNPTQRDKYPPAARMAGLPLGSHGTIEHDLHRKRRVANAPLFSKRAIISDGQNLIREHVKELIGIFEQHFVENKPIQLDTVLLAFTTDTLYHYAFDKESGLMSDPKAAQSWRNAMVSVGAATPFIKQFPWIIKIVRTLPHTVLAYFLPDVSRLLGVHKTMTSLVAEYIATREDRPHLAEKTVEGDSKVKTSLERPPTLFHSIERSALPPHEKNAFRLQQEGTTMLFAGSETTARLLAHTMFHLLDNPYIVLNIRKELWEVMGDDKQIPDLKILEKLPWLTASIRESLRLRAATTSRLPLVSKTALTYQDWVIPGNTPVSMSHPDILHDPTIYPEPLRFIPERWFNPTERANRSFVAFGKGTRMCQGMDFANAEMYITIATLFLRFDLELFETYRGRDIDYVRDCFLAEASLQSQGIRVKVIANTGNI